MSRSFLVSAFLIITGCGIEPGLSGKSRSEYLESIKPYAHYWEKPEMTIQSRRLDSWECGAAPTIYAADHVVFLPETEAAERTPEEDTNMPAHHRLSAKWVECMKQKGYIWIKEE